MRERDFVELDPTEDCHYAGDRHYVEHIPIKEETVSVFVDITQDFRVCANFVLGTVPYTFRILRWRCWRIDELLKRIIEHYGNGEFGSLSADGTSFHATAAQREQAVRQGVRDIFYYLNKLVSENRLPEAYVLCYKEDGNDDYCRFIEKIAFECVRNANVSIPLIDPRISRIVILLLLFLILFLVLFHFL